MILKGGQNEKPSVAQVLDLWSEWSRVPRGFCVVPSDPGGSSQLSSCKGVYFPLPAKGSLLCHLENIQIQGGEGSKQGKTMPKTWLRGTLRGSPSKASAREEHSENRCQGGNFYLLVCVCVSVCVLACLYGCHSHEGICRDQKVQTSLNWSTGNCEPPMRVHGTELRSSERTANILNCESFFQVLLVYFVFCSFETRSHGVQAGLAFDVVTEAGLELSIHPHFLSTGMGNNEASSYLRLGLRGWWHSVWTCYMAFLSYWVTPEGKWQSNWKSYWRLKLAIRKGDTKPVTIEISVEKVCKRVWHVARAEFPLGLTSVARNEWKGKPDQDLRGRRVILTVKRHYRPGKKALKHSTKNVAKVRFKYWHL